MHIRYTDTGTHRLEAGGMKNPEEIEGMPHQRETRKHGERERETEILRQSFAVIIPTLQKVQAGSNLKISSNIQCPRPLELEGGLSPSSNPMCCFVVCFFFFNILSFY